MLARQPHRRLPLSFSTPRPHPVERKPQCLRRCSSSSRGTATTVTIPRAHHHRPFSRWNTTLDGCREQLLVQAMGSALTQLEMTGRVAVVCVLEEGLSVSSVAAAATMVQKSQSPQHSHTRRACAGPGFAVCAIARRRGRRAAPRILARRRSRVRPAARWAAAAHIGGGPVRELCWH